MAAKPESLNDVLLLHWESFRKKLSGGVDDSILDGHILDLATVIAIARRVLQVLPKHLPADMTF